MIIIGNQDCTCPGEKFPVFNAFDLILHGQAFVTEAGYFNPNLNEIMKKDGFLKSNLGIGQDNPNIQERFAFPQSQIANIGNPGLFQVSQITGIIDVALRVEVAVADFDWVVEMEVCHTIDYTASGLSFLNSRKTELYLLFMKLPSIPPDKV